MKHFNSRVGAWLTFILIACISFNGYSQTYQAYPLYSGGPDATFDIVNVSCYGDSDGAINTTLSCQESCYVFNWRKYNTYTGWVDIGTLLNISHLGGTYQLTFVVPAECDYEGDGCAVAGFTYSYEPVVITQPDTPLSILSLTNVIYYGGYNTSVHGGADGSGSVVASGGTSAGDYYSYFWTNADDSYESYGNPATDFSAGIYTVTVTDDNGCAASAKDTLSQPPALKIDSARLHTSCTSGSDGSINLYPSGGVPPYSYYWSDENGTLWYTKDLNNIPGGYYSFSVIDTNGAELDTTFTLAQPDSITVTLTASNSDSYGFFCNGDSNSIINISLSGGTDPFTYLWSSGETDDNISGKPAGTYSVTVPVLSGFPT